MKVWNKYRARSEKLRKTRERCLKTNILNYNDNKLLINNQIKINLQVTNYKHNKEVLLGCTMNYIKFKLN